MRKRTVKHKNITRVDHPPKNAFGYLVRVRWKGATRAKFFSDKTYHDRLGALFAAIEWRDKIEQELGKPRTERQVVGLVHTSSGVPGVRRVREGHTDYYEATWGTYAGKQRRTKYSIAKHGEKRALRLAIKARERGERERLRTPAHAEDVITFSPADSLTVAETILNPPAPSEKLGADFERYWRAAEEHL